MLKMIYLCRRRPDITRERYAQLVLEGHAPLALRHHPTLRRYVINIALGSPPGVPELDSLPALYFDSLEDYRERLYDSEAGAAVIRRDVEGFMGGADAYATRETVHRDRTAAPVPGARSPGVKFVCPVRRRPELSRDAFLEQWQGDDAREWLARHPGAIRFTTNAVEERLSESGEDWDGFAELHFASVEDAADVAPGRTQPRSGSVGLSLVYPVAEYVQR